jgi:hypothetical protein
VALINCSFDTVTKAMTVTIDGAEVPDVVDFCCSSSFDDQKFDCSVLTRSEDDENKMVVYKRLIAKEGETGRRERGLADSAFAGFVERPEMKKVQQDIIDFLRRKA